MKVNYKQEQQHARIRAKLAKHGPAVFCKNCFKPIGEKGTAPAIAIKEKDKKTQYKHAFC